MARFICAVPTENKKPLALALIEVTDDTPEPVYHVRRLHALGEDGVQHILNDLADHEEYVGQTTLVVTGGQPAADLFRDAGPSAVAVRLTDDGPGTNAGEVVSVTTQVLVDTFARLYRAGAVQTTGELQGASDAIAALYSGTDLDAAASEGELVLEPVRTMSDQTYPDPEDGPDAAVVEQSGRSVPVSTGEVPNEMLGVNAPMQGRIAADTHATAPDLGTHRGVALALAMGCWYGEYSRDHLPVTDQADEA